LAGLMRK